jgi:hypothetical protein
MSTYQAPDPEPTQTPNEPDKRRSMEFHTQWRFTYTTAAAAIVLAILALIVAVIALVT